MTTVAVFAPLFFISGIVGKFIASIPYTVIFVHIASIFVALGLVPTLAITFTKDEKSSLANRQEEYAERARAWYGKFLHRFLKTAARRTISSSACSSHGSWRWHSPSAHISR